jgi:hypothetical protein
VKCGASVARSASVKVSATEFIGAVEPSAPPDGNSLHRDCRESCIVRFVD